MKLVLIKRTLSTNDNVAITTPRYCSPARCAKGRIGRIVCCSFDITNDKRVEGSIDQTIDRIERLDVVVNNAGYSSVSSPEELTDTKFWRTADIKTWLNSP